MYPSSITPPLSLVNTTSVLSASLCLSSAANNSPTHQSSSAMASPRRPCSLFPRNRGCGQRGTWASWVAKYRKNGPALWSAMNFTALAVIVSAMSSSFHRAAVPPVIHPMRLMPFTMVMSCPWLGFWFVSSSGLSLPVGSVPTFAV
jgi:hypothetical protein